MLKSLINLSILIITTALFIFNSSIAYSQSYNYRFYSGPGNNSYYNNFNNNDNFSFSAPPGYYYNYSGQDMETMMKEFNQLFEEFFNNNNFNNNFNSFNFNHNGQNPFKYAPNNFNNNYNFNNSQPSETTPTPRAPSYENSPDLYY